MNKKEERKEYLFNSIFEKLISLIVTMLMLHLLNTQNVIENITSNGTVSKFVLGINFYMFTYILLVTDRKITEKENKTR